MIGPPRDGRRDVRLARLGDPRGGVAPPKGFVTLGHHLLVLRAGERPFEVAAVPRAPRVGEAWRFDDGRGERACVIERVDPRGPVVAACAGERAERVALRWTDGAPRLASVTVTDRTDAGLNARLAFDDDGTFTLATQVGGVAIRGRWRQDDRGHTRLSPEHPPWAARRPVDVETAARDGPTVVRTRIGG